MAESQTLYTEIITGADDVAARKRRIDEQLGDITPDLKKAIARSDALTGRDRRRRAGAGSRSRSRTPSRSSVSSSRG